MSYHNQWTERRWSMQTDKRWQMPKSQNSSWLLVVEVARIHNKFNKEEKRRTAKRLIKFKSSDESDIYSFKWHRRWP